MKLSEHFDSSEFDCKCCGEGGEDMNPRLIELLEQLRSDCGGYPLIINSGYRCPDHNAETPNAATNSQHMYHNAADVKCPPELSYEDFMWYCDQLPFDGIGNYPDGDFVHLDTRNGGQGGPGDHIYWDGP